MISARSFLPRRLGFALTMLRRDMRGGEWRLLGAALLVAVAALSAVGFFTDRVRQGLEQEANQMLGADLLLTADHPWADTWRQRAAAQGLRIAETQTFPSMVMAEGEAAGAVASPRARLADIKAVSPGYPLRGALRISDGVGVPDRGAVGVPVPGSVWVDEKLATDLGLSPGSLVQVGSRRFRVAAILTQEPDRGVNFFALAPRLMLNLADLPATGLVGFGSRVSYRLLLAGERQGVQAFRREGERGLARGERIEGVENARPEIRSAVDRAQKFLGLSTMLTVVLAAVAVALSARRFLQRHLDPCAVMRCLGASQGLILQTYLLQFLCFGLGVATLGVALGYGLHFILYQWLAQLLGNTLPPPSWRPVLQGGAVGLLLLFGFALPPLLQLRRVPPLRVIRRDLGAPEWGALASYLLGFLAVGGLMLDIAGDIRLGLWVVGGFAVALAVFALVAWLALRGLGWARRRLPLGGSGARVGWRLGLASLERHAWASVIQIVALALGFAALTLLTVTRGELLSAWQRSLPADAPNRFVINIQPEQLPQVRAWFRERGFSPEFSPMVRARLTHIGDRPVGPERYPDDERAQRLVDREFNLSWRDTLPAGNRITAGRWFEGEPRGKGEASVEEGLAKTLGIQVGDSLGFSVAGEPLTVRVVGLRKLDWDSMRVNFFVLTPSGVLEDYPASWITSFHLPADQDRLGAELVRAFPNLTVIDVAAMLSQLQGVMDQVAGAVQFVFLFTLVAGLVVLYAAMASVMDERRYETAIMRALGGLQTQLRSALSVELGVVGALAGLIGALAASLIGVQVARQGFQLELPITWWLWPGAALLGASVVMGAGRFASRQLLRVPPLAVLREGN